MSSMSLAWSTVSLLVLLIPGFFFFLGLYQQERISRDTVGRSPLSQLAGLVFIAFVVHAVLLIATIFICGILPWVPCISLERVFTVLQMDSKNNTLVSSILSDHTEWIFIYILAACVLGWLSGWVVSKNILSGSLRFFARHGWVLDLSVSNSDGGFVHAYVLTNIKDGNRILMYRGFLKEFYFGSDGCIAYLVLKDCVRYYMVLEEKSPRTSNMLDWQPLGATQNLATTGQTKQWSYMMIEGEDIANVVFDRYKANYSNKDFEDLNKQLNKYLKELEEILKKTSKPIKEVESSRSQRAKSRRAGS